MRGAVLHAPADLRVEPRPDPTIIEPTDAIIRHLRLRLGPVALPWPWSSPPPRPIGSSAGSDSDRMDQPAHRPPCNYTLPLGCVIPFPSSTTSVRVRRVGMNPKYDFTGQVALVTVLDPDRVLSMAQAFAEAGAAVVLSDITELSVARPPRP